MSVPFYIVNVEAAIFKEGRYLMVVRGEAETHARGVLTFPGGKVEEAGNLQDVLEATLRQEINEEVGIEVHAEMIYLESKAFIADDGDRVVDIVFLCRYSAGTPTILDHGEVAAIHWLTAQEIFAHPKTPSWTRQSTELAERKRIELGWGG